MSESQQGLHDFFFSALSFHVCVYLYRVWAHLKDVYEYGREIQKGELIPTVELPENTD